MLNIKTMNKGSENRIICLIVVVVFFVTLLSVNENSNSLLKFHVDVRIEILKIALFAIERSRI